MCSGEGAESLNFIPFVWDPGLTAWLCVFSFFGKMTIFEKSEGSLFRRGEVSLVGLIGGNGYGVWMKVQEVVFAQNGGSPRLEAPNCLPLTLAEQ